MCDTVKDLQSSDSVKTIWIIAIPQKFNAFNAFHAFDVFVCNFVSVQYLMDAKQCKPAETQMAFHLGHLISHPSR